MISLFGHADHFRPPLCEARRPVDLFTYLTTMGYED
jgi:hypothetical protein